jgi:hypothetical protein
VQVIARAKASLPIRGSRNALPAPFLLKNVHQQINFFGVVQTTFAQRGQMAGPLPLYLLPL